MEKTDETENAPKSFRESIPTVDRAGKRVWVYPRQPPGRKRAARGVVNFYALRKRLSYVLLLFLFVGPFLRINGNPVLMMNLVERKASLLGFVFWPQDGHLFAVTMVTCMFMLVVFTAVFGRVFCGWLCPQTVLMELLFRRIEYWLEGDSRSQRALARAPASTSKYLRKALKIVIFFVLSFIIGNLLLAYIIGSDALIALVTDNPLNHTKGLTAMILFSFMFFGIFYRFREQACTFVCPYGRLQSVLLDEQSIVVAYDWKRGDGRGSLKRGESQAARKARGLGDCVDCNMCVEVCPTGIDIRNGTQLECVNCTACIDSCNTVMTKIGYAPHLIKYASLNQIAKGEGMRYTPRLIMYTIMLIGLFGLLVGMFATRTPVEASMLRTPGTWFQELPDGRVSNIFNLRLINKNNEDAVITLELIEPIGGTIQLAGNTVLAKPGEPTGSSLIVTLPPELIPSGSRPLRVAVKEGDNVLTTIDSQFIGPVAKSAQQPQVSP